MAHYEVRSREEQTSSLPQQQENQTFNASFSVPTTETGSTLSGSILTSNASTASSITRMEMEHILTSTDLNNPTLTYHLQNSILNQVISDNLISKIL